MNHATVKRFGHYDVLARGDGREEVHSPGVHDITYRAVDTRLDRRVHLRVLRPEFLGDAAVREAFLSATRALARIRHSNISGVLDAGEEREGCYCAIEDPSGESLESIIGRLGSMDPGSALHILDQCAKVLRELWQSGLVIARLAPATIAVCYEGDELVVKFTDLHLASPSEGASGSGVGKPTEAGDDFRSPEEVSAGARDIRSNIYSLGLVFCELLGGRGSGRSFLAFGETNRIPDLHPFRKLPEKILYLLEVMLHRDPARRIQTPYDLRSLIEQCEREGGGAGSLMIREEKISSPSTGEDHSEPEPLSLEFNLGKKLDAKGVFHEAEDRVRGGTAVIRLFGTDESPHQLDTCFSMAGKLLEHPQGNIVRVIRIQAAGRHRFIAYEKTGGFTLLEMMRKRRRLSLPEVLLLLSQAAAAADHGVQHDVAGLSFALHLVRIVPDAQPEEGRIPSWAALPLPQWPGFMLKIPVHGSVPGLDDELASPDPANDRQGIISAHLRALGETAHELLGGVKPRNIPFTEASYTPLSTLSEQGNIILRRALFGGGPASFASAGEFVEALKRTVSDKDLPASSAAFALPKDSGGEAKTGRPERGEMLAGAGNHRLLGIGLLLVITLIGAVLLLMRSGTQPPTSSLRNAPPQTQSQPAPPSVVPESQPAAPPSGSPPPDGAGVPGAAPASTPAESGTFESPSQQEALPPAPAEGHEGEQPLDKDIGESEEIPATEPALTGSGIPKP